MSLKDNNLWWSGPYWLNENSDIWPSSDISITEIPEERKIITTLTISTLHDYSIFERFSSYIRLVQVVAYCFKFVSNCQAKKITSHDSVYHTGVNLTVSEIQRAENALLRLVQAEVFSGELTALRNKQLLSKNSPVITLCPFLDEKGLMRVGGRLQYATLEYDQKHPVILPAKHPFIDLLIRHEHIRLLHAGCQHVVASLRERYWPLACKRNVKRVIKNCVRCFKVKPQSAIYLMGQLPAVRVTPARPFSTCGVDYAGPFMTKERVRTKISTKAYICIFVCFVTKAIHIELATDLSTEAFLNCFRRFIARRGKCQRIFSDNATNFVGANRQLKELKSFITGSTYNSEVNSFLNKEQIDCKFIPPQAPNFGGLWESAVKSAKFHLKRVIGEQKLTFEELYTLLTQIEACLNSRPLSPISSDPTDFNPLTPGHFLIGNAPNALPDHDLKDVPTNRLGRYQLIQQMFQHFWQRWHREYIHQLQQRNKWHITSPQRIMEGTLVILKECNLPPLRWCLGRITQLHPGKDGVVRVVSIKTIDGEYKRPLTKLCILPIEDNNLTT
ncbi:PREDICTED: uncharacterized protein LOC107187946 [Dufourea novaeangliae]|uniref:uncharacterized protein LOC107187946 n=1 Tax=Dufourea novaeangliae TaxID=178035 RepID=UPI00076711B9|nr:PREDICTED: uncharacterized protein LOC107187946 [Dufourea novaeangliae]